MHRKRKQRDEAVTCLPALRRARTRTLIQLGGLLEKAQLPHVFSIKLGDDLQQEVALKEPVMQLMGALLFLYEALQNDDISLDFLKEKGLKALANP